MPTVLYTAAVLCSMARPPRSGGGVLVDGGRIAGVGDAARLRSRATRERASAGAPWPAHDPAGGRGEEGAP